MRYPVVTLGDLADNRNDVPMHATAQQELELRQGGYEWEVDAIPRPVDYDVETDLSLAGLGDLDIVTDSLDVINSLSPEAAAVIQNALPTASTGAISTDEVPSVGVPDPPPVPQAPPTLARPGVAAKVAAAAAPSPGPTLDTIVAQPTSAVVSNLLSGTLFGVDKKIVLGAAAVAGLGLFLMKRKKGGAARRRGRR